MLEQLLGFLHEENLFLGAQLTDSKRRESDLTKALLPGAGAQARARIAFYYPGRLADRQGSILLRFYYVFTTFYSSIASRPG